MPISNNGQTLLCTICNFMDNSFDEDLKGKSENPLLFFPHLSGVAYYISGSIGELVGVVLLASVG